MKTIEELNKALLEAAKSGNKQDIEKFIIDGADVNTKDVCENASLHWASIRSNQANSENISILISNGANVKARDKKGMTPLHWAANCENTKAALKLIEDGADVNAKDMHGRTPLHWAAIHGYQEAARILIRRGADVNVKDKDGSTPLHLSSDRGETETTLALIEEGAEVHLKNNKGHTPFQLAFDSRDKETSLVLISHGAGSAFEKLSSLKVLINKIKGLSNFNNSNVEFEWLNSLTAHQAAAQGGFTVRMIELLRDHPSTLLQDAPEALVALATQYEKRDTAAAIQSFLAAQAIEKMMKEKSLNKSPEKL